MTPHAHHWIVETPCGEPMLHAFCHICGRERLFPAWTEDSTAFLTEYHERLGPQAIADRDAERRRKVTT